MSKLFPIKIVSRQDQSIVEEFALNEMEKAYQRAQYLESIGLDIALEIPGATHSLALSLKIPPKQFLNLEQELSDEISSHED